MNNLPQISDYTAAIVVPSLIKAQRLNGGRPEMFNGRPVLYTGGYCAVYPYNVAGQRYAVRCWHSYIDGVKERSRQISKTLTGVNLPYFVRFEYVDNGILTPQGIQPIVIMDWVDALPIKDYLKKHIDSPAKLGELADAFLHMTKELHSNSISHGDLQHGNIMVKDTGEIVLVDYDSMYVPTLDGWGEVVSGLEGYQHPGRWRSSKLSVKADYFSELVIYTTIKALAANKELWFRLNLEHSETMLFSEEDIKSRGKSPIFNEVEKLTGCSNLINAIREALACDTIEELKPLDEAIVPIVDIISSKWKDNGYKPEPTFRESDVLSITFKW